MMRSLLPFLTGLAGLGCLLPLLALPGASPQAERAQREFRAYLEADWTRWMELYPEMATAVGYPGQNRRWVDDSPAGIAARKAHLAESLERLKSISRDALPPGERLNYDLYRELLETAEEGLAYGDDPLPFRNVVPGNFWLPLNQMGGVPIPWPRSRGEASPITKTSWRGSKRCRNTWTSNGRCSRRVSEGDSRLPKSPCAMCQSRSLTWFRRIP